MRVTADTKVVVGLTSDEKKFQSFPAWTFRIVEFSAAVYITSREKDRRFASNLDLSRGEVPKSLFSKPGESRSIWVSRMSQIELNSRAKPLAGSPLIRVVVRAKAWGDKCAGLRRADGLARTRLGENDMPEVDVWRGEGDANKSPFSLLPQGSDRTLCRFGCHLVENTDVLPRDEGRIHQQQGPVGAYHVRGGLQINGFALGQAAAHFHGDLKRQPNRAPTLRVSGSLHTQAFATGQIDLIGNAATEAQETQGE